MTLVNETRIAVLTGNGVTTEFPFTFLIPTADDIQVSLIVIATGVRTVLSESLYSVAGYGQDSGGTVTYPLTGSPLASTHKIVIERLVPYTQPISITSQNAIDVAVLEPLLNRIVMQTQQLAEALGRAIKVIPGAEGGEVSSVAAILEAETQALAVAVSAAQAEAAKEAAEASAALAIDAQENLFDAWTGAWQTATAYIVGDLAREGGTTYICLIAHTSGTFLTDLGAGRWEAFAAKGDAGAGTGDVLAANNGSEYDAAAFRSNLSIQQSNARLTDVAGATYAQGDLVYFNGTNLVPLIKGAAAQTLKINPGATAPAWVGGIIGPTATTSGTEITFTGIPSGVTRIEILFDGVSFSGSTGDSLRIQLGDSGGFETTGYQSASAICTTAALTTLSTTLSFLVSVGVDVRVVSGQMILTRGAGNDWYQSHGAYSETSRAMSGGGTKTLSAELTQIKILGSEGGTFDAGSVTVRYS